MQKNHCIGYCHHYGGNTDAAVALVENLITKKPSNPRNRENRSRGDTGRSRKALPRMVKGHPYHFSQLRDQKVSQLRGYMFHKRESNSSDSEEERKRSLRQNNQSRITPIIRFGSFRLSSHFYTYMSELQAPTVTCYSQVDQGAALTPPCLTSKGQRNLLRISKPRKYPYKN